MEYTYDLTGIIDKFIPIKFHKEILASDITIRAEGVRVEGNTAYVHFPVELSAEEQTTLNSLFTTHVSFEYISVLHRVTLEYLANVKDIDYPIEDWIHNPDLSSVTGTPWKYWKIEGDTVEAMAVVEQEVVDETEQEVNAIAEQETKTESLLNSVNSMLAHKAKKKVYVKNKLVEERRIFTNVEDSENDLYPCELIEYNWNKNKLISHTVTIYDKDGNIVAGPKTYNTNMDKKGKTKTIWEYEVE